MTLVLTAGRMPARHGRGVRDFHPHDEHRGAHDLLGLIGLVAERESLGSILAAGQAPAVEPAAGIAETAMRDPDRTDLLSAARFGADDLRRTAGRALVRRGHRVTVLTSRFDPALPAHESLDGITSSGRGWRCG